MVIVDKLEVIHTFSTMLHTIGVDNHEIAINHGKSMFQGIIKTSLNFEHLLIFINFANLKNQRNIPIHGKERKRLDTNDAAVFHAEG